MKRPAETQTQRDPPLDWITGLRGLAAFYVLLSHCWYQVWPAVPEPYGYGLYPPEEVARWTGWLYYGHYAVVVFIVLSGFCLMRTVVQQGGGRLPGGLWAFWRRRARRILPPYYAALALSLLLTSALIGDKTGSQWDIAVPVTAQGVVSHLLMLQDLVDTTQINFVFWSIALEAHLYLLFPLLVGARRRWGMRATLLALGVLVYGGVAALEALGVQDIPPQFLGLVFSFALGMAAACVAQARPGRAGGWQAGGWACLAAAMGLSAAWGHAVAEQRFAFLGLLCSLGMAGILASAPRGRGEPANASVRLMQAPCFVRVGAFAYSLYLIHAPLLQVAWKFFVAPHWQAPLERFIALLACGVPFSLASAWLFFLAAERPFLRPGMAQGRPAQAA
jgi:peptidoglycan/LPS O-acetylase OafA/YrhL